MEGARRCAAFMHEHLPEHFKDPVEMVMVGGYVLVDITLRMLQPPELKAAQGFDKDYIIDRGLFVGPSNRCRRMARYQQDGPSTTDR